jgi:predicted restriction endonuclease
MSVQFYIDKFQSLKVDRSNGHSKPHKTCLLLAIIELVERGVIVENKFLFDEQIKKQFTFYFQQLKQGNDQDTPYLPFYHLQSSHFWHLKVKPEYQSEFNDLASSQNNKRPSNANIQRYVEFAFIDDELFDYIKSSVIRTTLKDALILNLDNLEVQYKRWALSIGKSDKTVKNYIGALTGTIPNWLDTAGMKAGNLMAITSHQEYSIVAAKAMQVEEFQAKNKKGNGMYSAALNSYQTFLADVTQISIEADIENIINAKDKTPTQKTTLINSRIGQGKFRADLIQYWQGCSLTRYKKMQFLIASHIKPWADSDDTERLDPNNGLLLLANIDKAFDLGYISFNDKGKIMISNVLDDYDVLGISKHMRIELNSQHQDYLAYHREITFKN